MAESRSERTAQRAMDQLGTAFRLHGRLPDIALDCVGLAAHAAEIDAPFDYCLRGDFACRVAHLLEHSGFCRCDPNRANEAGNIVLAQTAPNQMHMMIAVQRGYVHAHAGLRRVVLMPAPCPWPILGQWLDRRM